MILCPFSKMVVVDLPICEHHSRESLTRLTVPCPGWSPKTHQNVLAAPYLLCHSCPIGLFFKYILIEMECITSPISFLHSVLRYLSSDSSHVPPLSNLFAFDYQCSSLVSPHSLSSLLSVPSLSLHFSSHKVCHKVSSFSSTRFRFVVVCLFVRCLFSTQGFSVWL